MENGGSTSYRDMRDLYKAKKSILIKDSPELILEVDESLSDYCGNDSAGKIRHQNVYDEDQVRIHSGFAQMEDSGDDDNGEDIG